jgi:hypothetical protein
MKIESTDLPHYFSGLRLPELQPRQTANGEVWFREAVTPSGFKRYWQTHKAELTLRGFSLKLKHQTWFLQQWLAKDQEGNYTLTIRSQEHLRGQQELALPEPAPPKAETLHLPPLPDGLEDKLFSYQRPIARQLYRAVMCGQAEWGYPGAWDTSSLGTGKSFQSLAAALATGRKIGVVCPMTVIPAWHGVFRHFGAEPLFCINYETLRTGKTEWLKREDSTDNRGKRRTRYEWKVSATDTLIIFDEAHRMKAMDTLNTKMGLAAIRNRIPCMAVSATIAQSPLNMLFSGQIVGLHQGRETFHHFLHQHACFQHPKYGWVFDRREKGSRALVRIHQKVFPQRGGRCRIADLGDMFPETQIIAQGYETGETKKIQHAFKQTQDKLKELEEAGMNEDVVQAKLRMLYMDAWHNSERLKIKAIAEMVHEEIENGNSVAVFMNFTDTREELMRALNTKSAIYGQQKPTEREKCIEDFQADHSRVIVCNTQAGGVGVSLHDLHGNHPRTAIILPTNNAEALAQALGRVHRAGGKTKSRQIIFFAAGTIEEEICEKVKKQISKIDTLNDGDMMPEKRF